jgi:hypothetical protein
VQFVSSFWFPDLRNSLWFTVAGFHKISLPLFIFLLLNRCSAGSAAHAILSSRVAVRCCRPHQFGSPFVFPVNSSWAAGDGAQLSAL